MSTRRGAPREVHVCLVGMQGIRLCCWRCLCVMSMAPVVVKKGVRE
jgi:hypothetical protein